MPESIKIGIEAVDNTAAGISSATSSLQKLISAAQSYNSTSMQTRSIVEGWTKSEYKAAQGAQYLANGVKYLDEQLKSGKMTTAQATEAWKGYVKQTKEAVWQSMTVGEKYRTVSGQINDTAKAIGTTALKFGAVTAGAAIALAQSLATFGVSVESTADRLARFNSTVALSDGKYFTGLAIPAAAGVVASMVVFDHYVLHLGAEMKQPVVLFITLALSFLMVSTIKYRSFKDLKFKGPQQVTYLVWGILGLMLVAAWPQGMLFVIFAGYALLGPVERMFWLVARALGKKVAVRPEVPSPDPKP